MGAGDADALFAVRTWGGEQAPPAPGPPGLTLAVTCRDGGKQLDQALPGVQRGAHAEQELRVQQARVGCAAAQHSTQGGLHQVLGQLEHNRDRPLQCKIPTCAALCAVGHQAAAESNAAQSAAGACTYPEVVVPHRRLQDGLVVARGRPAEASCPSQRGPHCWAPGRRPTWASPPLQVSGRGDTRGTRQLRPTAQPGSRP